MRQAGRSFAAYRALRERYAVALRFDEDAHDRRRVSHEKLGILDRDLAARDS